MHANRILEWNTTGGERKCLLVVKDDDLSPTDVGFRRFEICKLEDGEWITVEKLDFIDEITDFGIPDSLVD